MPKAVEGMLLLAGIANLVLLLWFIFTLNKLKANTQELVELAREFVAANRRPSTAASLPAAKPEGLHEGMSADEFVAAIEEAGGRLRLLNDVMGADVVLDAPRGFNPLAARLVKAKKKALVQFLRARGG